MITEWKVQRGLSSCLHFSRFLTFALKHNPFLQLTSTSPNKSHCRCWICKWKVLLKLGGNISGSFPAQQQSHPASTVPLQAAPLIIALKSLVCLLLKQYFQLVDVRSSFEYCWYRGTKDGTAGHYFLSSSDC